MAEQVPAIIFDGIVQRLPAGDAVVLQPRVDPQDILVVRNAAGDQIAAIRVTAAADYSYSIAAGTDYVIQVDGDVKVRVSETVIRLDNAAVTINETGDPVDTRVEGDNLTHLLFASGADDNLAFFADGAVDFETGSGISYWAICQSDPTGSPTGGVFVYVSTATDQLRVRNTNGAITELSGIVRGATGSVADGGTINHLVGTTPSGVIAVGSVAGEIVSVTAIGATTFTVAIKLHDGTAGTTQTIYWQAF